MLPAHFLRESLHKGVEIERSAADPRACVRKEGYVLAHEGDCSGGRHVPGERRWRGWAENWPAQHVSERPTKRDPPCFFQVACKMKQAKARSTAAAPSSGGSATAHDATVSGRAPCACKSHSPLGSGPPEKTENTKSVSPHPTKCAVASVTPPCSPGASRMQSPAGRRRARCRPLPR
jgi:hypothetical protein